MSHGEDQSIAQYLQDVKAADRSGRWLQGPQITAEDLKRGSQTVERCTAKQWFQSAAAGVDQGAQPDGSRDSAGANSAGSGPARGRSNAQGIALMWFGKHKGRSMAVVQDEDPSYFRWALNEIGGFEAAVRKAELLDEEDAA